MTAFGLQLVFLAGCLLGWQCAVHKFNAQDDAGSAMVLRHLAGSGSLSVDCQETRTYCLCGGAAQSTDYAGYIRRAFTSEGLQGAVQKLPLERNFKLDHVKEVCAVVSAGSGPF